MYLVNSDDWDEIILIVLWAHITTFKTLTKYKSFNLVYGFEPMVKLEYLIPSLHVSITMYMFITQELEDKLDMLVQLEEHMLLVGYHQMIQKRCQKAWHGRDITIKKFEWGDLVLMYDNKFWKHLSKLRMHW